MAHTVSAEPDSLARCGAVPTPHLGAITSYFDADQLWLEPAVRGRAARRARALVRRAMPVAMTTPRWSDPGRFLDDLSLDLAVGEPPVSCRRVSFRHLRGADASRSRMEVLRILQQIVRPRSLVPPPVVGNRAGFRYAVQELVLVAESEARHALGLLFSETDHLPFEVGEDLVEAWTELRSEADLRITLLVAGSAACAWHRPLESVDLMDFGEHETAAELLRQAGPLDLGVLRAATVLSGGVPVLVDDLARVTRHRPIDPDRDVLLSQLGVLSEVRGAIDIASMEPKLGARLAALADEGVLDREDEDERLVRAGLVRIRRDGRRAELRAPAFRALI